MLARDAERRTRNGGRGTEDAEHGTRYTSPLLSVPRALEACALEARALEARALEARALEARALEARALEACSET